MTDDDIHPFDATLVALLDGALPPEEAERARRQIAADPTLAARLDQLAAGGERARDAFSALPPPPPELGAWLARQMADVPKVQPARRHPAWVGFPALRIAAALAAMLVAGIGIGYFAGRIAAPESVEEEELAGTPGEWREAVARYLTLYTADTLAGLPDDPALRDRQLAVLTSHLGVPLSAPTVAVPDLTFKRAQIFDYEGKPLGQIAYADATGEPVALCILKQRLPDIGLTTEERHGINIVYWSKAGRGYLLAGRLPLERLETMAAEVARRLAG
jgi:anti-sigma factor RsiW